MKVFYILFLIFSVGCASSKYRSFSDQEIYQMVENNILSSNFKVSQLLLTLKVNHLKKLVNTCQGVFPASSDHEAIKKELVNANKKFETETLVVIKREAEDLVVFHINEKTDLQKLSKNCQLFENYYKEKGYKIIPHSVF